MSRNRSESDLGEGKRFKPASHGRCICTNCVVELSANSFARHKHRQTCGMPKVVPIRPEATAYRAPEDRVEAARQLFDALHSLERMNRWDGPRKGSVSDNVHGALVRKVAALRQVIPDANEMYALLAPPRRDFNCGGASVRFAVLRSYPAGQAPKPLDPGPMPKFLRRRQG